MRRGAVSGARMVPILLAAGLVAACSGDGERSGGSPRGDGPASISECDWPMWGHGPHRTFSYPCDTAISPATVADLRQAWFFNADDTVTATPAVVDASVYVGDWSGTFYALDLETGEPRWTFRAEPRPLLYAGQIVSSAAVADAGGVRTVYFGGGDTLYALRAEDGALRWKHRLGEDRDDDPTEIESSPVVVDGIVIVGWDVHNSSDGEPAGLAALDAATGEQVWRFETAPRTDGTGPGCGDVWSSPSVDRERGTVFAGTGNCVLSPEGWGPYAEAVFSVDLHTGASGWVHQPHEPNNDDNDFAGAPNLFEAGGRALVGLGNKDGVYYAVDRETGELVWSTRAAEPGIPRPGRDYSTGGFIGPTAVADGVVVGGTAVGGDPYLHAFDAATGDILWQQPVAAPTYAAAAEANGVVFIGGTDFTFRALDLRTGEVLWSREVLGAVSGGAVVVGDDVLVPAGIREPGLEKRSRNSGVYRFTLDPGARTTTTGTTSTSEPATTTTTANRLVLVRPREPQRCVGEPCPLTFDLKRPPPGVTPTATLLVGIDPFAITVETEGLGPPEGWLRPGSEAATVGATAYGVFVSDRDDDPTGGGVVGVLDPAGDCTGTTIPRPAESYNRVTLAAMRDAATEPTLADGFDRLVTTIAFNPPLRVVPAEGGDP